MSDAYVDEDFCSEQTGRHPVWGINAPFRDLPGVKQNGYAMPVRYPGQPQAAQGAQRWGGGGQRLGGVPGSVVKPDPDGVHGEREYCVGRSLTAPQVLHVCRTGNIQGKQSPPFQ